MLFYFIESIKEKIYLSFGIFNSKSNKKKIRSHTKTDNISLYFSHKSHVPTRKSVKNKNSHNKIEHNIIWNKSNKIFFRKNTAWDVEHE